MRRSIAAAALTFAVGAGALPAEAQLRTAQITVTPVAGWYIPVQDLRSVPEGDTSVPVRRESSPMFGLAVEATFRGTPVSARGQVSYAPGGDLVAVRRAGDEACGTNCVRYNYRNDRLSSSSSFVAVGDAVLRAQTGRVRPYVAGGAGLRRYSFAQAELDGGFADAFATDVTRFVAHVGAGLEGRVGPLSMHLEVGDYFGHYPRAGAASQPTVGLQHDLAASFGVRFAVR